MAGIPGPGGPGGQTGGHAQTPPPPHHKPPKSPPNVFDNITQPFNRQINLSGLSPRQIQRLLRAKGYDVQVDGKLGARTKTAIDAYVHGKPPKQYNDWAARHYASVVVKGASPHTVAAGGAGVASGAGGGPPDPVGTTAAPKPKGKGGGSSVMTMLGKLLGSTDVGTMLPPSLADSLAGQQYDADITDVENAMKRAPAQDAQNLSDIGHFYDQVLGSEDTARARDHAASEAGTKSVGDAVAALVSSLGGSANAGAAPVAAEGADAVGSLAAEGNAQDFYNNELRPLLRDEAAGQKSAEIARQGDRRQALLDKLVDLKGQRGQAKDAALLDILGKNNDLAQTRFGNRASLLNTIASLQIAGSNANAKALAAAAKAGPKPISSTALSKIANGALSHFVDNDGKLTGQKGMPVQQVVHAVNNEYLSAGLDMGNPQVAESAMGVLRALGITPDPRWYGLH